MLNKTKTVRPFDEPEDIEDAEYPQEVIDMWDREFEIAEKQIEMGELKPMTIAEIAEKAGIKRDTKY